MHENKGPRPPLISDPDDWFLHAIQTDPGTSKLAPVTAKTGAEAQLLLANPDKSFSAIFVNPALVAPSGISVIRFAHLHHPALPIYVIHDQECPWNEKELKRMGVKKAYQKPITYTQILDIIAPTLSLFDISKTLNISKLNQDNLDQELVVADDQFIAVRADDFIAGSKSYFDVYVRLGSGRFIKILAGGDSFSSDRVINYLQKGVNYFYLRKEAHEQYLSYCEKIATGILNHPKTSMEMKISQVLNHGEETIKFFKNNGISDTNLQYSLNFVKNVEVLIRQIDPGKNQLVKGFLDDIVARDHGSGVVMIAALVMNPLQITSIDPVKTVGLAALFHDIGIRALGIESEDEGDSKMTEDQKKIFHQHPIAGAKILRELRQIHPVVIQAVEQHHERRNRKGYPNQLGPGSIGMVTEIVAISDEYFRIVEGLKKNPKDFDIAKELQNRIFTAFSTQVVSAFRKVFFPNEKADEVSFKAGYEP